MKNWKETLLFGSMLCWGISIVSCSEDNNKPEPVPVAEEENLEMGYYTPQISIPNEVRTRADGDLDDDAAIDPGDPNESKVNEIRLVYYNKETGIAEYAFDYSNIHNTDGDFGGTDMRNPNDYDPVSNEYFTPKAEQVAIRDYRLLVVINPNQKIKDLTKARRGTGITDPPATVAGNSVEFEKAMATDVGRDLTDFTGIAESNSVDITATKPDHFLMTNFQEFVEIPKTRIMPTADEAYDEADRAVNRVSVDRAVAKVFLKADESQIKVTPTGATISDITWRLDRTNQKSYWMRHMAMMKDPSASPETDVIQESVIKTTLRHLLYAEDPNFDKFSNERYLFTGASVPGDVDQPISADEFNVLSPADVKILPDGYEYVLENTMKEDEQFEDVTTAVVIRLKYSPGTSAMGSTVSGGYFVWNGYVFTDTDLKNIKAFDPGTNPVPDPEKYEMFLSLQDYLKKNAAALEDGTNGFGADYSTPGTTSHTIGNISYNADGINYYRALIRHFGDKLESRAMKYGRFGIVRNNVYKLTLTTVNAPGSIGIPEPKGPDDKQQYIAVNIEVLPWVIRDQVIHLGDD